MAEEHRFYWVQMSEWQQPESIINLISTAGFKWSKPGPATANPLFPHLFRVNYRIYEYYLIQFDAKGMVLITYQVLWMWGCNSQRLLINKWVTEDELLPFLFLIGLILAMGYFISELPFTLAMLFCLLVAVMRTISGMKWSHYETVASV